ncbi:MAG: serine/threonine protein kinase [Gemmataceae bacterium]
MSSEPSAKGPRRCIRIGKYEVLSHIATGGMGAVYKARDTESGRDVALKVLSPEAAAKPAMVERFRREAKHASKLHHENVVTLHEFGETNNTYYLVMEFVDGIDLHEYCHRKGQLDPNEALEIILQAGRALDHAHKRGVVHRDIKPSNLLITHQGERLVVKLTDLGLAREASNDEFRVTRAGTTVGTLDYMSPEQARDSGLADIRSDLYSLGGTWYHLLAGHPPFPKGGLGERLHRIMHEEPPDVRKSNPRVSEVMAKMVHRLLAKKPSQRYQTPADLLRDLEALKRGEPQLSPKQALEILAQEEGEPKEPPRKKPRSVPDGRRTPRSLPAPTRSETKIGKSTAEVPIPAEDEAPPSYLPWYGLGGAAVIVLVSALVIGLNLRHRHRQDALDVSQSLQPDVPNGQTLPADDPNPPVRTNNPQAGKPDHQERQDSQERQAGKPDLPQKTTWPVLYRPSQPIDAAALRKEIETPWAALPAATPTVELIVGRLPPVPSGKTFRSLAAACNAIPAGATGIIELRDNGPFFDIPASLAGRSLVLRAAAGYQPLLVWDVPRSLEERRRRRDRQQAADDAAPLVFLEVKHGNLTLQDVHLAFKWPDASSERATVLNVEDGDLTVRGCTFSVAGKPRDGVTLARFGASPPPSSPPGAGGDKGRGLCRFERCYVRGSNMSVLNVNAPGARILIEKCLFVGDAAPLLRVHAANDRPTRLQAVRSTMICDKNLLELSAANPTDHDPAFEWLGWDVLLCRKNAEFGGELLRMNGDIGTRRLKWRALNCLYAGWSNLLAGSTKIAATDLSAWRRLLNYSEGDESKADPWPTAVFPEPAEVPSGTYHTAGSIVAFAASTSADQPLGCDLDGLPAARDNWLSLTFDRYAVPAPSVPDESAPPEIPVNGDGLFHGAQVDLNKTDLGLYWQNVQNNYRLAPQVVFRLSGSGERLTTPLRIKGTNLVLYFEPPPEKKEKQEPLILAPGGPLPADALFEVEQGNLSIVNGNVRFSETAKGRVVPWLIKMHGGDLRLFRTHLQVPPKDSGAAFRGLISLDGSGETAIERVCSCVTNESVLVSSHDALDVQGIGVRVLLTQTLLIAGGDAIHLTLDPDFTQKASGPSAGKANVQCLLSHATVAARDAFVYLPEVKLAGPPAEPVIVQSHDCGFYNLFPGRLHRPSLVRYEGDALAHGLLIWQSEKDAFDNRLWFGAIRATTPLPDRPEDHASWLALWGAPGLRNAQLDLRAFRTLDAAERWPLEQRLAGWKAPGANLDKLELSRKPATKAPR